jgi:FkbM family methyltransferase
MPLKRVKSLITGWLARRGIYVSRALTKGPDPWNDITKALGWRNFETFVDVGANAGQSVDAMLRFQPAARVWAFEPSSEVFAKLNARFEANRRIRCSDLALSNFDGKGTLNVTRTSVQSHLDRGTDVSPVAQEEIVERVEVEVRTLDSFCSENGIAKIDYLKIDAEGSDLDVLQGGERMLRNGDVFVIQCECGMYPGNTLHVPFETVKAYLEERGYYVFGIYDQAAEWLERKPYLRRVNALFMLAD